VDNLKVQGTKAFIWDFAGKIAMQGTSFIISIVLVRLLEPSDFGLIAMVMVILGIAGIFSDIGLNTALIQRKRVLDIHYNSVFYFNISISFVLTALTFLSAELIASFYNNQSLIALIQVSSLSFILSSFNNVHISQFRKKLNFKVLTQIIFISSLLGGIIGVIMAFQGFGVWSLIIQYFTSTVINTILLWYISTWRPRLMFSWKALSQLWNFGFRMFLSALLDNVFNKLDYIIIGKLFPPAILGFFQRAKALDMLVISYASGSLMTVLFPVLSKVKNDLPRFKNIIIKSFGIICFVTFFLLGCLFLVSEELIVILFTEKWLPSVAFFNILIFSGFAYPVSALLVNILSSRGNSKAFLHLEIYKKILFAINLYIGFLWGIEGYLYGLIIASIGAVYLNIVFASKEINIAQLDFIKPIFVQSVLTIIVTFCIFYINLGLEYSHILMFILKGLEFTLLYIAVNYLFQIQSYQYFMEQFKPILNYILERIKR
jgi:O-antigen/teichoic acid export membrane protein